jgi:hypothetical protein
MARKYPDLYSSSRSALGICGVHNGHSVSIGLANRIQWPVESLA